ncbi:MAG: class I SAM-dependent methyltransferase, partial [Pseudomonadota bacterium]
MADAKASYASQLTTLLSPFAPFGTDDEAELATLVALRTRLPPAQGVMSYAANVFRDWCWGEQENALSYEMVAKHLPERASLRVLVLGSGAGRLAYDLHQQARVSLTVALDINPLLARIANELAAGREIDLQEFPLAPRRSADVAIARTLRAPTPTRQGLHFVLGDVHRPPFAEG